MHLSPTLLSNYKKQSSWIVDLVLEDILRVLLKWQPPNWIIGLHLLLKTVWREFINIRSQSISGDGPIEFHLSADPEKFIDISTLTLHGRAGVRVKGSDGKWGLVSKDTPKPDNWGVINHFGLLSRQKLMIVRLVILLIIHIHTYHIYKHF